MTERELAVLRWQADLAGWNPPWIVGWYERRGEEGIERCGLTASRRQSRGRYEHREWHGSAWSAQPGPAASAKPTHAAGSPEESP